MDSNLMKNMIVIKNIPSNMVEEAFVVLKNNVKIHKTEKIQNNKTTQKETVANTRDYMIKEAELIVSDYISQIEKSQYERKEEARKLKQKYARLKALTIFLAIFSTLSLFLILLK